MLLENKCYGISYERKNWENLSKNSVKKGEFNRMYNKVYNKYKKMVDFIPSVSFFVETFKKIYIIIDESTVENERSDID